MPKNKSAIFFVIISISALLVLLSFLLFTEKEVNDPRRKSDNRRWRIGYYEGGPWVDYQGNLIGIVHGLMHLGWIEPATVPLQSKRDDTGRIWKWLSENAESAYVEFAADAYWSSGWKDDLRERNRKAAIDRLASGNDIDLMIAAGTWAGQDLATDLHSVPVIVISASNPIQSGIIKGAEDSGYDHVFAKVDPERYIRQLRLFHALTQFRRLGIIYEDTPEGRSYAALRDVRKVGAEKGFQVLICKTDFANKRS